MIHFTKSFLNTLVFFLLLSVAASAQHSNCSVSPYENTITQPDGSKLTLKAFGNEAIHYLETSDGFTVLKNAAGYFEYATTDEKGNLTTSGVVARNGQQGKAGGVPHLRYSAEQRSMMMQLFEQTHQAEPALGKLGQNPFPSTGVRKLIVILVEYPDLRATLPKANFELLLNQPGYNGTGSFRDFYLATSGGKLEVNSTVYGWVMAANNYKYYGKASSPNYGQATRQLLLGALADAKDSFNIDFSQYDNDGDGYVDGVIIMHAGRGAEESSAPNSGDYIWSFRSTLQSSQQPTYDGVKVAAYAMFPEKRYSTAGIVGIGVMCHEFGHLLDLPDLYSTQYLNEGAGNYSLMAGGCWLNNERTPCFNDAWSRIAMGWVSPTMITTQQAYTLPKSVADSDMVYKVTTSRTNEYYLLENRQRKGFDKYLPSKGLAIWHINTNYAKVLSVSGMNNVNNDSSQLGVGLIQADGLRHLERNSNRGDANDMYPLSNKKAFGPATVPASNLHYKIGGVRQPSNLAFTDITQLTDSGIVFEFGAPTSASFSASKVSGCAPLTVTLNNTSFGADAYSWSFGPGNSSTDENPTFIFEEEGDYVISLIVYKNGEPADTAEQSIKVYGSPTPSYTYVRSDTSYTVAFTNTSTNATAYQWVFNGATTTSLVNPILTMSQPGILIIKLSAYSSNNCSRSITDTITFFKLGLFDKQQNKLQLVGYPNPFGSVVNLSLSVPQPVSATVELFDMLGARVYSDLQNLDAGTNELSIASDKLGKGIYFVKVSAGDMQGWIKLVKE